VRVVNLELANGVRLVGVTVPDDAIAVKVAGERIELAADDGLELERPAEVELEARRMRIDEALKRPFFGADEW
jgi:hypothetical protein